MKTVVHNNNFNFLRFFFAALVVFSHAYALLGQEEPTFWGRSLGNLAVHGFFVISGYLICQSYVRSPNIFSFTVYRFLRIVPGLLVALVVTRVIAKFCDDFKINPVPYISNGPVWTLTWEIMCYLGLAILGLIGVLRSNRMPGFFSAMWVIFMVNISSTSDSFLVIAPLVMMFLMGSFFAVMEEEIDYNKFAMASVVGLMLITNYSFFEKIYGYVFSHVPFLWGPVVTAEQISRLIYLIAFPFFVIFIGKLKVPNFNIKNDVSYGIYIYGWPAGQALVYWAIQYQVELSPIVYFLITMFITLPFAYASWILVEKPSLTLKRVFVISKFSGSK